MPNRKLLYSSVLISAIAVSMATHAALSILNVSASAMIDSSWDEKSVLVSATTGNLTITIPQISTLPVGFHIPIIQKVDASSNLVQIAVSYAGDTLNHFWNSSSPYPLMINLSQDAAELVCDGISACSLQGKAFHRGQPQSQRTIIGCSTVGGCNVGNGCPIAGANTIPYLSSYNVTPQTVHEVVRVNATCGSVGLYFAPVTQFTNGGYLSENVCFQRTDATANSVTVFAYSGDGFIDGATSKTVNGLAKFWCAYIASDSLNVWGGNP